MLLDEVVPRWHFRERHVLRVAASVAAVAGAIEDVTWREVPLFRALMHLRALGAGLDLDRPVLDGMTDAGFAILSRDGSGLVFGLVVPAKLRAVALPPDRGALAAPPPGHVAIAGDFTYDGETLSTETRVLAGDPGTRRRFRVYWALIRPFSGLIRREWLRAIAARATGPYLPPPA